MNFSLQQAELVGEDSLRGTGETILVVEDEDAIRCLSVRILQSLGYQTIEARSGDEALALCLLQQKSPDLIMTDLVMPSGNGRRFIEELYKKRQDIRVLYVSGYTEEEGRIKELKATGVTAEFLSKPYTRETLAFAVKHMLSA